MLNGSGQLSMYVPTYMGNGTYITLVFAIGQFLQGIGLC
jgi:hypothetical protein